MSSQGNPDPAFTAAVAQAVGELLPSIMQRFMQQSNAGGSIMPPPPPPPPYTPPRIPTPPHSDSENNTANMGVGIHEWLSRFQKQKPKSFSSAPDPMDACNWIMHVEKIFEVLGVDEQFKVRLASYKLEDDAQSWWRGIKHARGGDSYAATLPWSDFKEVFYQQYFPASHQDKYLREYASIAQRDDEPMREFMARFTRLASFLGDAAGTPQAQANKLKWAVCERVRKLIVMTKFNNITEVADAVQTLEMAEQVVPAGENRKRDREGDRISHSGHHPSQTSYPGNHKTKFHHNPNHNRQSGDRHNHVNRNNNQPFRSGPSKNHNHKPNQNHTQSQNVPTRTQSSNQNQNQIPPCATCGKAHRGVCRFSKGLCFRCGLAGHLIKDCPQPNNRANTGGNTARSTAGGRVFALTANEAATTPGHQA